MSRTYFLGALLVLPVVPVVLALAPDARAQSTTAVVPQRFTAQDADGLDVEPFGHDRIRHVHYIGAPMLAGVPQNVLITKLAYRRDATVRETLRRVARGAKVLPVWQTLMSNFVGEPNAVAGTFPPVGSPGWSVAFAPKQVDFPDLPPPSAGTVPGFDIQLPLDVPFLRTTGGLAIDHFAYENSNAQYAYFIDAVESQPSGGTVDLISPNSLGCPTGQNRAYGNAPNPGGGTLDLFLFGAEPGIAGSLGIGFGTSAWGTLPLPFSLTPLGLAGCNVYVDLTIMQPLTTTLAGTAEVHIPAPRDPNLVSAVMFAQFVTRDSRVNPAVNIATSDGLQVTLGSSVGGGIEPMSVVSGTSTQARGRSGLVQYGRGPVVQLTY